MNRATDDDGPLDAGRLDEWADGMLRALRAEADAVVPCAGCTACCASSQFVLVEPDDVDARAHIPAALLFPAPRRAPGYSVMGYDERGHCPMLVAGACSIYEHRPRACRTYDCRVFAATGIELTEPDQHAIARRTRRWRFSVERDADRVRQEALRAAADFVRARAESLPDGRPAPVTSTQRAVLAVELHQEFLPEQGTRGAQSGSIGMVKSATPRRAARVTAREPKRS